MSNILKYKTFSGNIIEGNLWIEMFKTADQYQEDGWWCVPLSDEAWNLYTPEDPETEEYAGFYMNTDITDIVLPNVIRRIGSYVFEDCTKLVSVNIPESVTEVGKDIFRGTAWYNQQSAGLMYLDNWCLGWKTTKPSGSVVIPDGTVGICSMAMGYCDGINSVHLPDSILYICSEAFSNCGNVDLNIPPNLVSLGDIAFIGTNISLPDNTFVVPETLTYIGSYNFGNSSITNVISYAEVPPTLGSNNFKGDNDTLCVYEKSLGAYQNSNWANVFTNIITMPNPPEPETNYGFNLSGMIDTDYMCEI